MRTNRTKAKLLNGELAIGIFVQANDLQVTGAIAAAGFDFIHYDMEHTSLDAARLETLVRAADAAGITPLVRVANGTKPAILPALEVGAQGIMVPAVESAAEAAEVVRVSRYFPEGERGVFTFNYNSGYGETPSGEHYASANREVLVTVQIETATGVENAAAIAAVPGVDALFIGPGDLSQSLGVPGQHRHERVAAAVDHTLRATLAAGKICGAMPYDQEQLVEWAEKGIRFLVPGLDTAYLKQALAAQAAMLRERVGWVRG
jgi:4-hydroxy-2-oxoheptanedioate aldolase